MNTITTKHIEVLRVEAELPWTVKANGEIQTFTVHEVLATYDIQSKLLYVGISPKKSSWYVKYVDIGNVKGYRCNRYMVEKALKQISDLSQMQQVATKTNDGHYRGLPGIPHWKIADSKEETKAKLNSLVQVESQIWTSIKDFRAMMRFKAQQDMSKISTEESAESRAKREQRRAERRQRDAELRMKQKGKKG